MFKINTTIASLTKSEKSELNSRLYKAFGLTLGKDSKGRTLGDFVTANHDAAKIIFPDSAKSPKVTHTCAVCGKKAHIMRDKIAGRGTSCAPVDVAVGMGFYAHV